ncbi:MAG: DNA recombination protein RmuC [Propionibacteriaceae bacterium]|jgi:DNA recombination protein RmuC|nr:DNA recombination protein RmuC [Propionibacteriaceae bacterium]
MDYSGWIVAGVLALAGVALYALAVRPANARAAAADAEAESARQQAAAASASAAAAQIAQARAESERDAAREQLAQLKESREELANQFKAISADVLQAQDEQARKAADERLKATETVLAPVRENLDKLQSKLTEVENQRVKLTAELSTKVDDVKQASERLRSETSALATALRKPQTRGSWGELQLKNVAEAAGMREHVDFSTQFASQNAENKGVRPDMKVEMGEGRFIFVDSKVPMGAFLDALEKEDESQRAEELKRVSEHVRKHITALAAKGYFTADAGTPEFTVLFIPHEAMAAEALAHDPKLYEFAFAQNIVIATPSSLIAMLKAVAYSWQQNALAKNAQEIAEIGAELYRRVGTLGKHFAELGKSLGKTVSHYNDAVGSLERNVITQARRMHQLGVKGGEPAEVAPLLADVRGLQKAELVAGVAGELPELPA